MFAPRHLADNLARENGRILGCKGRKGVWQAIFSISAEIQENEEKN